MSDKAKLQKAIDCVNNYLEVVDVNTKVWSLDMSGLHGVSMQIRQGEQGRAYHEANWAMRQALAELKEGK